MNVMSYNHHFLGGGSGSILRQNSLRVNYNKYHSAPSSAPARSHSSEKYERYIMSRLSGQLVVYVSLISCHDFSETVMRRGGRRDTTLTKPAIMWQITTFCE